MTNYEKLKRLIDEIDVLIQKNVISTSSDFRLWKSNVEDFLVTQYGEKSHKYGFFRHIRFRITNWDNPGEGIISVCRSGLEEAKKALSSYLPDFKEEQFSTNSMKTAVQKPLNNFKKVFVVHGHDIGLKEAVARLLERQGIEPVSLQEKANPGLATIIEKFETNSTDVDAAICLFTADDVGGLAISKKRTKRARQNVVLETGFFIGKLGRDRVIIIKEDGVEIPSDLAGMDLPTANKADWKSTVLQTLAEIGYSIEQNR